MSNVLSIDTRMCSVISRELRKVAASELQPCMVAIRPSVSWRAVISGFILLATYAWYTEGLILLTVAGVLATVALWIPMYLYACFGRAIQPIECLNWDLEQVTWNDEALIVKWSDCLDHDIESTNYVLFDNIKSVQYFPEFMIIRITASFSQDLLEEDVVSHYDRNGYLDIPDAFVNNGDFLALIKSHCMVPVEVCLNKEPEEIWE